MNNLPNHVNRRLAFIGELRLLRDFNRFEVQYLQDMAGNGERSFWEAIRHICGEQAKTYIQKIAEKCAELVDVGLKELGDNPLELKHGKVMKSIVEHYMIVLCALELAQYENTELYKCVNSCAERALACLSAVIPLGNDVVQ